VIYQIHQASWQGIPLSVSCDPEPFSSYRAVYGVALSRVIVSSEDGRTLPPAGIGWVRADVLEEWGGPVAYVLGLLDLAASDPAWKAQQEAQRQLALF
jgi:hypothetical protein